MGMILPELELKPMIKTNNSTLQEVLLYCSSNFAEDITLDDVSGALHISKFHISHLLNEKLGLSFVTYLNTLRIHNACDLLEDTDKKMAEISADVGFGSIRSFNRAFQTAMNMSPSDYRNQFKE
jgi:transcriptional regulator GlxA family with amidase domain